MTSIFVSLMISVFVSFYFHSNYLGFGLGLILFLLSKERKNLLFYGLSLLFLLRLTINLNEDYFYTGRVVELNQNSVLIQKGFSKELVIGMDVSRISIGDIIEVDQVSALRNDYHLYGFNVSYWQKANHIIGTANYVLTQKEAHPFLQWLSFQNGINKEFQDWYRHLLFQVSHESVLGQLFSMGILFSVLIEMIESFFIKFRLKHSYWYITVILFILMISLGFPLSLIRIMTLRFIRQWVKRRDLHFFISFMILFLIEPYGLTQLSWNIPLALMALERFSIHRIRFIERMLVLNLVFLSVLNQFSWVHAVLYTQLRKLFPTLMLFLFLARLSPYMQDMFVSFMNQLNVYLVIVKSYGRVSGHLSLISLVLIVILFQLRLPQRFWYLGFITIVFIINPLTILPFFDQIIMINVGQGDSFLFLSQFRKEVILLDTGNKYANDTVIATLNYYGVTKITALILSHEDADHSANSNSIQEQFQVNKVVSIGEDIRFSSTVLRYLDGGEFENENDQSLIYYLDHQNVRFLFLADVSQAVELQLIKRYPNLKVDVLKVAHHGSSTSTSLHLLHQIHARIALISVGQNSYGHPSNQVLAALNAYQLKILSTRTLGDIRMRFIFNGLWMSDSMGQHYFSLSSSKE